MKKALILLFAVCFIFSLTACGGNQKEPETTAKQSQPSTAAAAVPIETTQPLTTEAQVSSETSQEEQNMTLKMSIGNTPVSVDWEDNESVKSLKELCKNQPLTIQMSMYGGFEQVGSIGSDLPSNDAQTTTSAGDIVLYSGNQMVVFYGSNTWAYTRLGHISDKTPDELTGLLSNGNVTITLTN